MRNTALLLGILVVTACSIDHVMVAALDEASAAGAPAGGASAGGASLGGAGSAGARANAGAGGVVIAGASQSESDAGRVLITTGGSAGTDELRNLAGEGGVGSELFCSCLGTKSQFCGSDGVTYPVECADGDVCLPPAIDCWHACPCLTDDAGVGTTSWFSLGCVPSECTDGVVCMLFTNVVPDHTICTTTGN